MKIDDEILNLIYNIHWFENCGKTSDLLLNYDYKFISKTEMKRSFSGVKWNNLENNEFNNLYDWFKTSSICLDWERSVREIRKYEMPKFDKLVNIGLNKIFPHEFKSVLDNFHYDLLMIIMQLTISKRFKSDEKPIFYNELLKVYQAGNFPCGWKGKFPNGNLLIY